MEGSEEQNYSFVDGSRNNPKKLKPKSEKRPSVLKKLHDKQAEIARRSGKAVPQGDDGTGSREETEVKKRSLWRSYGCRRLLFCVSKNKAPQFEMLRRQYAGIKSC